MLATAKKAIYLSAIAIGSIVVNFSMQPSNAQSTSADSFNFEEITVGDENNWNFSGVDKTISIRNNLTQLKEYDISGVEYFDVRSIQRRNWRNQRGGNNGDRYYHIDNRIFPYYPVRNGIYNYY